jgi:anti-sigma factor RsiW
VANSVRSHVPEEELHAYSDGELSPPQRIEIAEHLLGCLICRSHYAEVGEVRARTSLLLAIAAPRIIHRPAMPQVLRQATRRRLPGAMTAVAAAVVGLGLWFSLEAARTDQPTAELATSLLTPAFLGGLDRGDSDAGTMRARSLVMASRAMTAPHVLPARGAAAIAPRMMNPAVEVDPVIANDWVRSNWDDALKAGSGSLARVTGLTVASVRMHASANGGRPVFMVRQQLADGRPVWVFEGPVDDIAPVNQVLQASGIAMSMLSRTHPDYVGLDGQITRTVRIVTVVGHLPVDSLNVLIGKVQLQ